MKKRMVLALVLVLAMLCMACANDANEGTGAASGSESSLYEQSVSVSETSTESSAESTSSTDGTSGETSTESDTSSDTSSGTTTSAESTSSADGTSGESNASSGTESSATSSDTSTSSKPAENSENSKPTEGSENSGSVDTSSGSGNTNPSQTGHKHSYKTTVVKPTCTEDGYTLHKCSCGDSYTDNEVPATGHDLATDPRMFYYDATRPYQDYYTEPPVFKRPCLKCEEYFEDRNVTSDWEPAMTGTEEDLALVRERFQKLKEEYPEGTKWDSSCKYSSVAFGMNGSECAGFALLTSDYLFGTYWAGRHTNVAYDNLLPGDIVHITKEYNGGQTGHWVVIMEVFDDYVTVAEGNYAGTVHWGRNINRDAIEHGDELLTRYNPPPKTHRATGIK